jgi:hypothetical protein
MKTKALQQTVLFKASPRQVYDMLMDSKKHQSLSGQRARVRGRSFNGTDSLSGMVVLLGY